MYGPTSNIRGYRCDTVQSIANAIDIPHMVALLWPSLCDCTTAAQARRHADDCAANRDFLAAHVWSVWERLLEIEGYP
jgi:hypothetical protein